MTGVALVGLSSCQRQQESALKPIDKAALQTMLDTTAKELLIPCSEFIERKPYDAVVRESSTSTYLQLESFRKGADGNHLNASKGLQFQEVIVPR